ncbi:MAG: methyltransferase domain-containing protein [Pseudomonadota bacterium]
MTLDDFLSLSTPAHRIPCDAPGYKIYEAAGYRWLSRGEAAVQSVMSLEDPDALVLENHHAMLALALHLRRAPRAVLDLGTGGGAFLRYLIKHLPKASVTSVEYDSELIGLLRHQFAVPPDQPIVLEGADRFLKRCKERFDVVLVDLFDGRDAPAFTEQPEFFERLGAVTQADGLVMLNTLPSNADQLRRVIQAASEGFGSIGVLQSSSLGNVVLALSPVPLPARAELIQGLELSDDLMESWRVFSFASSGSLR